jgi:hypothetical protein
MAHTSAYEVDTDRDLVVGKVVLLLRGHVPVTTLLQCKLSMRSSLCDSSTVQVYVIPRQLIPPIMLAPWFL